MSPREGNTDSPVQFEVEHEGGGGQVDNHPFLTHFEDGGAGSDMGSSPFVKDDHENNHQPNQREDRQQAPSRDPSAGYFGGAQRAIQNKAQNVRNLVSSGGRNPDHRVEQMPVDPHSAAVDYDRDGYHNEPHFDQQLAHGVNNGQPLGPPQFNQRGGSGHFGSHRRNWRRSGGLWGSAMAKLKARVVPKVKKIMHEGRRAAHLLRDGFINMKEHIDATMARRSSPFAAAVANGQVSAPMANQAASGSRPSSLMPSNSGGSDRVSQRRASLSRTLPDMIGKEAPVPAAVQERMQEHSPAIVHNDHSTHMQTSQWQSPAGNDRVANEAMLERNELHGVDQSGEVFKQSHKSSTSHTSTSHSSMPSKR